MEEEGTFFRDAWPDEAVGEVRDSVVSVEEGEERPDEAVGELVGQH